LNSKSHAVSKITSNRKKKGAKTFNVNPRGNIEVGLNLSNGKVVKDEKERRVAVVGEGIGKGELGKESR